MTGPRASLIDNGPSHLGFIFLLLLVCRFLESNQTLSPFLNGMKVDFRLSAMRVRASSCAAMASSRFLIRVFIQSSTAGYLVFSNKSGKVIGFSPNMSSMGVFIRSACLWLLCVNSNKWRAVVHSLGCAVQ